MDQTEAMAFLQANDVLGPDHVRFPELFEEVFAVPPAELRGGVINVVEGTGDLEYSLELTVFSDIAPGISGLRDIAAEREADLLRAVGDVNGEHVVPSRPQILDQPAPDRAERSRHKNALHSE